MSEQDAFSEIRIKHTNIKFDSNHTALLVVDIINDFFEDGGSMVLPGAGVLYKTNNQLIKIARAAFMPIFWLNQWVRDDDSLFLKRGKAGIIGTWGAEIPKIMDFDSKMDIIVPKRRYSGFFQTDLDLYLRERGIKTVIITGVVTNICVRSTCHDAFFLGYHAIIPEQTCMGTSPRQQEAALYDIDTHYGDVVDLPCFLGL